MNTARESTPQNPPAEILGIPLDPAARELLIDDLIARAHLEISSAAWIQEINQAFPGEAHNIGGALLSLGTARFALGIAEALSRPRVRAPQLSRQALPATR